MRHKEYILILDTETANTIDMGGKPCMDDVLCYDIGWVVTDRQGTVYETASFVNKDIFVYELALMKTAYYNKKIPLYFRDIQAGTRILASLYDIRQAMLETIDKYKIKHVCAHNARFDYNALNRTQSYVTKSKMRFWFPYGRVIWWDSLKMARSVVAKMPTYRKFCEKNGYLTKTGRVKLTAEILYRFITRNTDFKESHTGLEDVLIEKEIVAYCFKQKKRMNKELWQQTNELPPKTDFQIALMMNIKAIPTLHAGRG